MVLVWSELHRTGVLHHTGGHFYLQHLLCKGNSHIGSYITCSTGKGLGLILVGVSTCPKYFELWQPLPTFAPNVLGCMSGRVFNTGGGGCRFSPLARTSPQKELN